MHLGPDARRYLLAAHGDTVPRPFHLRWLLPKLCGTNITRWMTVWLASWPVLAAGMFLWQSDHGWRVAAAATVLLLALPGILGPAAVIPVGVDLPATAVTVVGCWLYGIGHPAATVGAFACFAVGAAIRETVPVWAALWLWTPTPLLVVLVPAAAALFRKPGPDPLGPKFQAIADHPIRSALAAHRGQWRDAWVMVAPWGACLAALLRPSWPLVTVLVVAYLQLLVATDTVRLVHHAAGPVLAVAAAQVIPPQWLLLVCVVHVVWWRPPVRI